MGKIHKEFDINQSNTFKLGEYIYLGMAKLKGVTVVISVAYKIDYCIKKARLFVNLSSDDTIIFYKINKVKVGELEAIDSFLI